MAAIERVVDSFRRVLRKLQAVRKALLRVELRSQELLVTWVAFCLIHKATCHAHPLLRKFSVPLDAESLRHLALSQKTAIDAVMCVASYLRAHKASSPVFSLLSNDATFLLAREFARDASDMSTAWQQEKAQAQERQQQHWDIVVAKQRRLQELDAKLRRLESQKRSVEREFDQTSPPSKYTTHAEDKQRRALQREIDNIEQSIRSTQSEIKNEERPPAPIFQPLPAVESAAMPILFFVMMPLHFQLLSRMSLTAKQLLLPEPDKIKPPDRDEINIAAAIQTSRPATKWRDYYQSGSTGRAKVAVKTKVILGSYSKVPQKWGPENVRQFTSSSDGVWHPDSLEPALFWDGGDFDLDARGVSYFNPFSGSVIAAAVVHEFTEQLPAECGDLQWAMPQHGSSDTVQSRGNKSLASQNIKPKWLSKPEFLAFGALRAFPLQQVSCDSLSPSNSPKMSQTPRNSRQNSLLPCPLLPAPPPAPHARSLPLFPANSFPASRSMLHAPCQMRKICVALHERGMPLEHPAVRLLFQQTMFHIGDITVEASPRPLWRTDLIHSGGWETLRQELAGLADELRFKPRDHGAVLLLGQLSAHASQWDDASRSTARCFAEIARSWADDVATELAKAEADKIPVLRARRCLFYMYSLICHSTGELSEGDAAAVCELVVLANYNRLFEDPTPHDADVRALTEVTHNAIAHRLPELLESYDRAPQMLTNSVKLVIEQTPQNLHWRRVAFNGVRTACFEAVSPCRSLYSINVQTGTVLVDGLPPHRLPLTILRQPLYQRTFADRNFEVTTSQGVLTTTRRVGGCFYSFFVSPSGALIVQEKEVLDNTEYVLELLDGTPIGIPKWGDELPTRLQSMHSHWLCRERNVVVLRPPLFSQREVHFLLLDTCWTPGSLIPELFVKPSLMNRQRAARASGENWICSRVPGHRQREHWWLELADEIGSFDQLVITELSVVHKSLLKFEPDSRLLHIFLTHDDTVVFELPRFDLSFELKGGALHSQNFLGFAMSKQQQMNDALYNFQQYLVLDSAGAECKIVVPTGTVQSGGAGHNAVVVCGDEACEAVRSYHHYNVHSRFGTLEATCIEARLQLAALYSATGSELPEKRSRRTGGEVSMELVRQCWVNRPLKPQEQAQLRSVSSFGQRTPALALLCFETDLSARELHFLSPTVKLCSPLPDDNDACIEYTLRKQASRLNACAQLTADEEERTLGVKNNVRQRGRELAAACPLARPRSSYNPMARASATIKRVDDELQSLLRSSPEEKESKNFPLKCEEDNKLGKLMMQNLRSSWIAHQQMEIVQLAFDLSTTKSQLREMHMTARRARIEIEQYLVTCVNWVPLNAGWHAAGFRMRRAANLAPQVTLRDLARSAVEASTLRSFNPFMSEAAKKSLLSGILDWLQLCVLEDKITRLCSFAEKEVEQELERELREVGRPWSVTSHPEWLVSQIWFRTPGQ